MWRLVERRRAVILAVLGSAALGCAPSGVAVGVARLSVPETVQALNVKVGVPTVVAFQVSNRGYGGVTVGVAANEVLLVGTNSVTLAPGAEARVEVSVLPADYASVDGEVVLTTESEALTVTVHATVDPDSDADGFDSVLTGGADCDDANPFVFPGAIEKCDGADGDCNEVIDDAPDAPRWYRDDDGDSFGVSTDMLRACSRPHGFASRAGDCDDASKLVYPGAPDTPYDGVDADCDEMSDFDADSDGFDAISWGGLDCADNNPHVHPDIIEVYYDGLDANCDQRSDFDADTDGFDAVAFGGADCADDDDTISPDRPELLDGIDQNCDGLVDETYFVDGDLIVTEIMGSPTSADGEYIEIMHASPRTFEIVGLTLEIGSSTTVFTSAIMHPGDVRVFCLDSDPALNGGVDCDDVLGGALEASAVSVYVGSRALDVVDVSEWAFPVGASLEVAASAATHLDNDSESAWCPATALLSGGDAGTPGTPPEWECGP